MFKSKFFMTASVALALVLGGCAKAMVDSEGTAGPLPKPDMIVVNNFAVTPNEVQLDRGVVKTAMRDTQDGSPTQEENQVGHMVAQKLAQTLVDELRKKGITAVRAGDPIQPTAVTVFLYGQFVTIDQGNQTARVWVGFGMGGSELRTRIQAVQGGRLVAQADTSTKSGLKPGMLTSLGAGAAADSASAVVVGAAGTGLSETFTATVEADARRTAKEVAEKIHKAYVERGWLAN